MKSSGLVASRRSKLKARSLLVIVSGLLFFGTFVNPPKATADSSQGTQGTIVINPGGGVQTNGSDGLQIVINGESSLVPNTGSDQVYFANTRQWCCSGTSPLLNIGGQLFGEAGAASYSGANSWTSVELTGNSGAVQVLPVSDTTVTSTTTGSATITVRYTALYNSLTYIVDRRIVYTYPNNYYKETYTFTIPDGNTDVIKFYQGGDAAPGSSDTGRGFSVSTPTVAAYEVNPNSGIYISYQEIPGGGAFDGLYAARYSSPFSTIASGGDIGFVTNLSSHDAGLDMQWNLGSTPGSIQRSMITQAGFQATQATASFATSSGNAGDTVNLIFQIVNTNFSSQSGLTFDATLPSGLTIAGTPTNACGGTLTATNGGTTINLTGGTVDSGSNCTIEVPVTGGANTYNWSDQDLVVTSPLEKGFSTSSLTLSGPASPSATPSPTAPTPTPTPTVSAAPTGPLAKTGIYDDPRYLVVISLVVVGAMFFSSGRIDMLELIYKESPWLMYDENYNLKPALWNKKLPFK